MARGVEGSREGPGGGGEVAPRVPILNAPRVVVLAAGVIIAAFVILALLPPHLRALVYQAGAVSPPRLLNPDGHFLSALVSLPGHMLFHDGIMHVGLNSIWLLAFGSPVARRMGAGLAPPSARAALSFVALFVASGIAGALFYVALNAKDPTLMLGASDGVSGLLGALVRFAFLSPNSTRRPGEVASLFERQVLIWSAVIIGLNVFAGLFSGALGFGGANIAWQAHIGGYLFGLLAFPAFLKLAKGR